MQKIERKIAILYKFGATKNVFLPRDISLKILLDDLEEANG